MNLWGFRGRLRVQSFIEVKELGFWSLAFSIESLNDLLTSVLANFELQEQSIKKTVLQNERYTLGLSACDVPSGSLEDRQWSRLRTEGCLIGLKNKSLIPELSGIGQISVFHNPEVVVRLSHSSRRLSAVLALRLWLLGWVAKQGCKRPTVLSSASIVTWPWTPFPEGEGVPLCPMSWM